MSEVPKRPASSSWVGIALSISSIIIMPLLGRAKQRVGERLGSGATTGEGLFAYLRQLLTANQTGGALPALL